jgi:hypothetical protein
MANMSVTQPLNLAPQSLRRARVAALRLLLDHRLLCAVTASHRLPRSPSALSRAWRTEEANSHFTPLHHAALLCSLSPRSSFAPMCRPPSVQAGAIEAIHEHHHIALCAMLLSAEETTGQQLRASSRTSHRLPP